MNIGGSTGGILRAIGFTWIFILYVFRVFSCVNGFWVIRFYELWVRVFTLVQTLYILAYACYGIGLGRAFPFFSCHYSCILL